MPVSPYIASLRAHVGHDLLMLPAVTAVIRDGDRFLLARHSDSGMWGLIGGSIEPGEHPADAMAREVREEIGAGIRVLGIVGVYGGEELVVEYPNGDRVAYVTTAYSCGLTGAPRPDLDEILEVAWFTRDEISALDLLPYVEQVLRDA
ncbi:MULTISPECIES: NUDIX domain-containing protein [unclassified Microbacterium]|uniref:NUDIX domain-containing protein n=1 Tax=unclassified Microbacterium TaxID=2609290 RepID=UPI0012F9DCE4|nr:NUDIX domain-containing protein [Microbacterium sp. MAH-37]MVQ42018.1 NUDIX domain-containing protein [Microbacterium sp. MAH-37]